MRFTVHDSPDYYQLKVSVFNDDKKTELIGETWVALDTIVVPGGGRNDVWYNLNCKGRYAGEIRIELTYYDTRPREGRAEEHRLSGQVDGMPESSREGLSGPRQPKPVKRRPLPADPTNSNQSTPLPHTPPVANQPSYETQQRYADLPDDYAFTPTPPQDNRYQRFQNAHPRESPLAHEQHNQLSYSGPQNIAPSLLRSSPKPSGMYNPAIQDVYNHNTAMSMSHSPQNNQTYDRHSDYDLNYEDASYDPAQNATSSTYPPLTPEMNGRHQQSIHPSRGSPAAMTPNSASHTSQTHRSSLAKSNSYDDNRSGPVSPLSSHDTWTRTEGADEQGPPLPPAHRVGGNRSSPQYTGRGDVILNAPVPITAPLNIRNARGSVSNSPLTQVHTQESDLGYPLSASPSNLQGYSNQPAPVSPISSRSSINRQSNRRSPSPIREYGQAMPPSLVAGYEPSIAADESERLLYEQRMISRQKYDQPMPPYQQATPPHPQSRAQPVLRGIENIHERRAHRSSAPIIKPRAVSPDPRTPMRKSISPQPGSAPAERRHSELPFSPDSYDAFNPSLSAAKSINDLGARYNTPEQAREAFDQHQREVKRGDGPIIGSDGRVIDPSDHLPTDTWAPEPEHKAPRKGPEVTLRFRNSPQGAQPMPNARRPLAEARPNSMSSPIISHSNENTPPTSATRARLQKKSRGGMPQPASSPIVPTLNTTASRRPMPPSSASDYPLRENENHGYGSSPTYAKRSPGGFAPPIPAKVPIGSGQEDWGMNALSEEMSRIDIGVGGGQRPRRSRYGA